MADGKTAVKSLRHGLHAGGKHGRLLGQVGGGRDVPPLYALTQRRVLVDVQLVAVRSVQFQGLGHGNILTPAFYGLAGETVNQIYNHGGMAVRQKLLQAANHFFSRAEAAHGAPDVGMKTLHAQRKTVGAAFKAGFHLAGVEIAQAAFHGDFAVVGQGQDAACGLEQAQYIFRFQFRGGAPAKVEGVHRPAFQGFAPAPQLHLGDDGVCVQAAFVLVVFLFVKPAKKAVCTAKRHMNVGHGPAFALLIKKRVHERTHFFRRYPAAPKAGMHGNFSCKGVRQRRHSLACKKTAFIAGCAFVTHQRRHAADPLNHGPGRSLCHVCNPSVSQIRRICRIHSV